MTKQRKARVSYEMVEEGLNRNENHWYKVGSKWSYQGHKTPIDYIRECKSATGLADWKIAHDMGKDAGVEVTAATVRNWRLRGEKSE